MSHFREEITLKTRGETDVIDVTGRVRQMLAQAGVRHGTVHLFVPGSTAGLTTIEYEPGCVEDLQAAFERVAPRHEHYAHNARWGDGNGYAHVRAAMLGPALSIPVADGELATGTWQQLILVDFDNRRRDRRLIVTITGAS
ncbi:MAG: secondary thiamine-phosphate synthase enzyme YjbQ [Planctomycetota bacterium]